MAFIVSLGGGRIQKTASFYFTPLVVKIANLLILIVVFDKCRILFPDQGILEK